MAIVARGCEPEALLRIFDFVENRRPKDRCYNLNGLIDCAFKKHWIPHDALRYWKREQRVPLKLVDHRWLHVFVRSITCGPAKAGCGSASSSSANAKAVHR